MILVLSIQNSGTFFVVNFLESHGIALRQDHFKENTVSKWGDWDGKIVIPYRDPEKVIESNVRNGNRNILEAYKAMRKFSGWYFYINDPDRRGALFGLHDYCGCTDVELTEAWLREWPIINSQKHLT